MSEFLQVISQNAQTRSEALALVDESRRMSYGMLVSAIEARARALGEAGVQSGDRIALVAENSADYLIAVLAIWTAGGVPVTIYPSTSAPELARTLQDADPVLAFSDEGTDVLVRAAADGRLPVTRLDEEGARVARSAAAEPTPESLRADLALICYSSGTTARPKAIMLSAAAILNSARTFAQTWRMTPQDVTLVCLPMAWLFGLTTSSMTTLFSGGTVVSLRRAKPEVIAEAVEDLGVTFLPAVTTVLTKLANFLDSADRRWDTASLRLVVSGGEPRNEASFAALREHVGVPVHDNYCASEMQPLVTYDPQTDPEPRQGSAGRLVPRAELRVLNAEGEPVAQGEVGEAFSRGPGIMLGYWNDPQATFAALTEDGWYRTKDLLRVDEDGYVHVVGRASDMIIRGGSNVSPKEVEQHISQHDSVADVAVVGVPDPSYGEEIVAVIQMRSDVAFDADELREFARAGLSGFKVPTRFVRVDRLPHSATGKVNRRTVKQQLEEGTLA